MSDELNQNINSNNIFITLYRISYLISIITLSFLKRVEFSLYIYLILTIISFIYYLLKYFINDKNNNLLSNNIPKIITENLTFIISLILIIFNIYDANTQGEYFVNLIFVLPVLLESYLISYSIIFFVKLLLNKLKTDYKSQLIIKIIISSVVITGFISLYLYSLLMIKSHSIGDFTYFQIIYLLYVIFPVSLFLLINFIISKRLN